MSIFDNHTSSEAIECHTKDLQMQERLTKLVGFVDDKEKKHLGYYSPIVNPCGDYNDPNSYIEAYKDEYRKEYRNVKGVFPIDVVDFYYWDLKKNDRQILPALVETTLEERTASLFAKDLITNDTAARMAYLQMIREWILLNSKCSAPVFIDKEYDIHSDGDIAINPDVTEIPDYIKFASK